MDPNLRVSQGTFLAAGPDMLDPNFAHSVVLICEHTGEGAYGLVVNRPTGQTARSILAEHPPLSEHAFPIYQGGPVGLDTLQILHRADDQIPGGVPLLDDLWIGGELEDVARLVGQDSATAQKSVRLFLGYAGWSPGQLEYELAAGAWLPAVARTDLVFGADGEATWREVVRSVGSTGLEDQPPDPTWN